MLATCALDENFGNTKGIYTFSVFCIKICISRFQIYHGVIAWMEARFPLAIYDSNTLNDLYVPLEDVAKYNEKF